jgi:hypothetical protein
MKQTPRLLAAAAVVTAVACSESFTPTTDTVIGSYQLLTFTSGSAGTSRDLVAVGASLDLLLLPFGDVVGQLNVPGDTTMSFVPMIGSWTLTGSTIRFTQTADTFVRNMDWTAGQDRLSADKTFGAVRLRVVLKKLPGPPIP